MNLAYLLMAGLVVVPAVGVACWASFVMSEVDDQMRSFVDLVGFPVDDRNNSAEPT